VYVKWLDFGFWSGPFILTAGLVFRPDDVPHTAVNIRIHGGSKTPHCSVGSSFVYRPPISIFFMLTIARLVPILIADKRDVFGTPYRYRDSVYWGVVCLVRSCSNITDCARWRSATSNEKTPDFIRSPLLILEAPFRALLHLTYKVSTIRLHLHLYLVLHCLSVVLHGNTARRPLNEVRPTPMGPLSAVCVPCLQINPTVSLQLSSSSSSSS